MSRVGITNLRTLIQTTWRGHTFRFTPEVEITIDLASERKGVHMSRLIEAITQTLEDEAQKPGRSIEEIERRILERLLERHQYRRGDVRMTTDLIVFKRTPVSLKRTMESHKVEVTVTKEGGRFTKRLKVTVLGNTVCPHSMITAKKPHIQRAIGELEVETAYDTYVSLEDMIKCVEKSFSAEVYTLLKTEDEKQVVKNMFENPKFVEDVVRDMLRNAKRTLPKCRIRAKAISQESIHRHDVIAEGTITT